MSPEEEWNEGKATGFEEFEPARFPVELGLGEGEPADLDQAARAVHEEYRSSSGRKRLRCEKISIVAERERGSVYVLEVGGSIDFDWTWEGAVAFRPENIDDEDDHAPSSYLDTDSGEVVWSGEILEVDERNGTLFVVPDNPNRLPTTGTFIVRPFEFLAGLDAVYHDPGFELVRKTLPGRLAAAAGGVHPDFEEGRSGGLPFLRDWWAHRWCLLWGPPGTGKTYLSGRQIASVLSDPGERILVVSTTNRATDAIAVSIGEAAGEFCPHALPNGRISRIGKGASPAAFAEKGLERMLEATDAETLAKVDELSRDLLRFKESDDRALARKEIRELRALSQDRSRRTFLDPGVRTVITTSFKAISFLNDEQVSLLLEEGDAPFTTIVIDEAGLISRAAVAALSLLAGRRVVLAGDSRQLAPISRISRVLPSRQKKWIASSGLGHLDRIDATPAGVHVLFEQHRMHPDVCRVVSDFHYNARLTTAARAEKRESRLPRLLADHSRAVWYVLDEEGGDPASIRAEKGPGNRSWIRTASEAVLQKLFSDEEIRSAKGLFISPYTAQSRLVARRFAEWKIETWSASTVHSQQGSEADIVIFDTVSAGSCHWPFEEWKRMVNVGISRAREAVILLSSRSEMSEPFLRPLLKGLTPGILVFRDGAPHWENVPREAAGFHESRDGADRESTLPPETLGFQIAQRKRMQPVMSREQQQLCELEMDGKPRLVRGIAGSGKSFVLSNWLAKTVFRSPDGDDGRIWAVYANRSLQSLLRDGVERSWRELGEKEFPWSQVELLHVREVLDGLLAGAGMSLRSFGFDYDRAAEQFLKHQKDADSIPRCDALFIDEAQDMGPNLLRLLISMVGNPRGEETGLRPAHIFYDNAQNLYGRKTPDWKELGIDLEKRSTIMRESFRSTRWIMEFALNAVHRLGEGADGPDVGELVDLELVERTREQGKEWLRVGFNQVDGPPPVFRCYPNENDEWEGIGKHLVYLIEREKIAPNDICVIYNSPAVVGALKSKIGPKLAGIGVELSIQTRQNFERNPNTLLATTTHSFKGFEAEVVLIPCANRFVGEGRILVNNLFVAMTRARSLLALYSSESRSPLSRRINEVFTGCAHHLENHRSDP